MAHVSNPRYEQAKGAALEYQNCPISIEGDGIEVVTQGKKYKANRRFAGWKQGVLWGATLASMVLALNITLIVVALRKDRNNGIVTLYSGDVDSVRKANLRLHILINVCSTLLLSASNYGMQVLCSPTRADCDEAHRKNNSLIIGMLSMTNVRYISWRRKLLWTALAISSIPLHLFYNGSIYQVEPLSGFGFNGKVVEADSSDWSAQMQKTLNGTLRHCTIPELRTSFERHEGGAWQDIILSTDKVVFDYNNPLRVDLRLSNKTRDVLEMEIGMNDSIQNQTIDTRNANFGFPIFLDSRSGGTSSWLDKFDKDGWMPVASKSLNKSITGTMEKITKDRKAYTFEPNKTAFGTGIILQPLDFNISTLESLNMVDEKLHLNMTWGLTHFSHVNGALVQPYLVDVSRISLNLPLILVVAISNAIKVAVLLLLLSDTSGEPPLVTIGDAISSFLERPDSYTADHRNSTQEDFLRVQGTLKDSITPVQRLRTHRVNESPSQSKWTWDYSWLFFSVQTISFLAGLMTMIPVSGGLEGWGTASKKRFDFSNALDGNNAVGLSVLVNGPQLILSLLYMTGNQICTRWATTQEYNAFGTHMKPLRVSKPEGRQRGTRFLQLPFRWAIPMSITSGSLHWLLSQTIFLIRQDEVRPDGSWDRNRSVAACGVSGTAALVMFIILLLVVLIIGRITRAKTLNMVPATGQYSWCISSACHPPDCDVGMPLDAVAWGLCSQRMVQRPRRNQQDRQKRWAISGVPTYLGSAQHEPIEELIEYDAPQGYSFSLRANLGPTYLRVYKDAHARWRRRAQDDAKWRAMRDFAERLPGQKYPYQNPNQDPSMEELEPYRAWLKTTFKYVSQGRQSLPFPSSLDTK